MMLKMYCEQSERKKENISVSCITQIIGLWSLGGRMSVQCTCVYHMCNDVSQNKCCCHAFVRCTCLRTCYVARFTKIKYFRIDLNVIIYCTIKY